MRRPLPDLPPSWPVFYPLHRPVSTALARSWDAEASARFRIPSLVLMEHASHGVAAIAALLARIDDRIVVLCGPGNNGGDGYGAARFLRSWGYAPRVLRLAPRPPSAGDSALEAALAGSGTPSDPRRIEDAWSNPPLVGSAVASADLVIDAIFGTGVARVEGPFPEWIEAANRADALRLAVDVPSGLDADEGTVARVALRADVTATMAAPKQGLVFPSPGAAYAGRIVEVDIGLPAELHSSYALRAGPPSGGGGPAGG